MSSRHHNFLAADEFVKCKSCEEVVCKSCYAQINDNTYCLLCYAQESLVLLPSEQSAISMNDMRVELVEYHNFDNVDNLTMEEVEDTYAIREAVDARLNRLCDDVPFPLYNSSEMEAGNNWETIANIDFADGGAFIANPNLDPKHIPGILEFFASLVCFKSSTWTDHIKDPTIYNAMPEVFINWSEKSRVDSGYRLMSRMVRHAFDSRMPNMDESVAKLIVDEEGNVGIQLSSEIPASMKKMSMRLQ